MIDGYFFLNGRWALTEWPEGGVPRCRRVTATRNRDGCIRYSYNPRTKRVRVGRERGRLKANGILQLGRPSYDALVIPRPGTRLNVNQRYSAFYGFCGLVPGCTTFNRYLRLLPDGQFALGRSSISTFGGIGPRFIAASNYPPDERGRYVIGRGGRIRLLYASGSRETSSFAIITNRRGRPSPQKEGVLLDDGYYFFND